jgi:16S rRNA (guanine(966)-N(2))-methyltransferase RsmD
MRVIAGKLRSRTLHAPSGRDTRPTHDRVREALFSVLGDMNEYCVLDLCAGTGSLGIEALSRGARHAVFVESGKDALRCLTRNLTELGLTEQATVIPSKVETCRTRLQPQGPYDLIFCDPPWVKVPEIVVAFQRLELPTLLSPEGRLILEHSAKFDGSLVNIQGLCVETQRRWGDTAVTLFTVAQPNDASSATESQ